MSINVNKISLPSTSSTPVLTSRDERKETNDIPNSSKSFSDASLKGKKIVFPSSPELKTAKVVVKQLGSAYQEKDELSRKTLSCGSKHDTLISLKSFLEEDGILIPTFFGFTHDQIFDLFSAKTKEIWAGLTNKPISFLFDNDAFDLFEELQKSVKSDILSLNMTSSQLDMLKEFKEKKLIVRSSSNEDGKIVNAGGNESIPGVDPDESSLKAAISQVVSSYFSLQSFKNRSAFENPFSNFPLCSVLVMEQIIEERDCPIVSGVMMTSKPEWSDSNEEGITYITASWGFGSGTSNITTCDEWVMTNRRVYSTIRHKLTRMLDDDSEVPNPPSIKNAPSLSKKNLKELKLLAKKFEDHFKQPMDVEFVIKNNRIFIVQARPVRSPNLLGSDFLDLTHIPGDTRIFKGEMIVSGLNQVISLNRSQILFAKSLSKAEKKFKAHTHKMVVVLTPESSNTHSAINFASHSPPIPCLVLPYSDWRKSKAMKDDLSFTLCPQQAILSHSDIKLPIRKGLFLHPARLTLTLGDQKSIKGKSDHPGIQILVQLLNSLPEHLKDRLYEIEKELDQLFGEIFSRTALTSNLREIAQSLKKASLIEIEEMKISVENKQMTGLAFHAGILRQLIDQSNNQTIGAHTIAGLESVTSPPEYFNEFFKEYKNSQLHCELAFFGLHGFEEQIQRNWLLFLKYQVDESLLKLLLERVRELEHQDTLTQWLSLHFSDISSTNEWLYLSQYFPGIFPALIKNLVTEDEKESNSKLTEFASTFKNLQESIEKISRPENLENIFFALQENSEAYLSYCKTNELRHPLILDLIDLWDLFIKSIVKSKLFSKSEEGVLLENTISAFEDFALQASESCVLKYSLKELIIAMGDWGKRGNKFSVQHWLIPISHGALSRIETFDQRLTVIHQNLLQAAAFDNPSCLPSKLKSAHEIFKAENTCGAKRFSDNGGTFISVGNQKASIRVNIPLNLHSMVVTLSQKKREEEIEITAYFRGSDNWRGIHLAFFIAFSDLLEIPLFEHEIAGSDLKVVFKVKRDQQIKLVSRAINKVNFMSLHVQDDIAALKYLLDPDRKDPNGAHEKIISYAWERLKRTGKYLHLIPGIEHSIFKYLQNKGQLSELTERVIEEFGRKRTKSDFMEIFGDNVLKTIPRDECEEIVWNDLINDQRIPKYYVPEEIHQELMKRLFDEHPARIKKMLVSALPPYFVDLMDKKLNSGGIKTHEEMELLFHMAYFKAFFGDIPEKWIEVLRNNKEEITVLLDEKRKDEDFINQYGVRGLNILEEAIFPEKRSDHET